MSEDQMSMHRAKVMAMLQFIVPVSTLVFAAVIWYVMDDDIGNYIGVGLVVIAVFELFTFRAIATKAERQVQRDRG